jgi:serine protease Do
MRAQLPSLALAGLFLLGYGAPLPGQDAVPPPAEQPAQPEPPSEAPAQPAPAEAAKVAPATVAVAATPVEPISPDKGMLWRLEGGGEIVGEFVKETPSDVYIDIGPQIISVPVTSVLSKALLTDLGKDGGSAGVGTGVFDSATGSLIFRSRDAGSRVLSQQEVLETVKRGVVLVSNPGGLGTGWLIDNEGRLLTNHHVVGNESYQTVTLFVKNGNQWDKKKIDNCSVEAFSSLLDLAIVKLDMAKVKEQGITLYPLTIAAPDSLEPGDVVYAVGNPGMGRMVLDHTISEGIVSSLTRNFNDVIYLQTTAAVNPGNSGGPLINQRGEVVGVVTLKAIFQEGVAFALPVDYVIHFLKNSQAYALDDANRNKGFRYLPPK